MSHPTPSVTPHGVRDGDPASLAGLAQRRSGSVLDYARHACGERAAMDAAAEAFARFRAAVVAADDLGSLAPDALLLSCTRNAAAAFVQVVGGGGPACHATPHLIVGRFEATNAVADSGRLARHLETCSACMQRAAAFDRAERAFRAPHPPEAGGVVVARVVAALESAAPITWRPDADGVAARSATDSPVVTAPADDEPLPGPDEPHEEITTATVAAAPAPTAATAPTGPFSIDVRRGVLVPAAIVTVSAGLAMSIAGVFGGTEPTPARGAIGLPAPTPPDRPPLADDRTQERASEAARAALRRIERRDRRTTRLAQQQRAAEQQRAAQQQAAPGPDRALPGDATDVPAAPQQPQPSAPSSPQSQGGGGDGSSIETVTPEQGIDPSSDAPEFEPAP